MLMGNREKESVSQKKDLSETLKTGEMEKNEERVQREENLLLLGPSLLSPPELLNGLGVVRPVLLGEGVGEEGEEAGEGPRDF